MPGFNVTEILAAVRDFYYQFSSSPYYPLVGGGVVVVLLFILFKRLFASSGRKAGSALSAAKLEKEGFLKEAAEAYLAERKYHKAAQLFMRVGMFRRAAECYELMGQKDTAASLYARAGDVKAAVEIYTSLKMFDEALNLLERNQKYYEAAELASKINQPLLAAKYFEKAGLDEQAGFHYFAAGNFQAAAQMLGKAYARARREGEVERTLAEKYAISLEKIGEHLMAGRVWASIGEDKKAAEAFEKAGEFEIAASIYDRMGMREHAEELRKLAGAKERTFSAETIEHTAPQPEPAAGEREEMVSARRDPRSEAVYLLKQGRLKEAAEKFAEIGDFLKAAQIYQHLGEPLMQSQMLFRAGKYYEAVLNLYEHGNLREAEEMAAGVPESSPDYKRTCLIWGDILFQRGDYKRAASVYARALKGEPVRGWNIRAFYNLALIAEDVKNWEGAYSIYKAIYKVNPNFLDVEKKLKAMEEKLKRERSSDDQTVPRFIVTQAKKASEQETSEPKEKRRYTLIEEIGRGGMGVVYKAFDNLLERYVALKILPSYMQKEKGAVENFIKEAKATAALTHPNIVTVYDAGEQDGNYYIAMELVEGETLKDMIRRLGRINLKAFFFMAAQICKAIAYAHSKGIIHRDIKPGNIMWTKDKMVKVMDLGLAKIIQDAANFHTVVGGTPHYMAPEQILGDTVTFATDIYSLGVTFYEMLTGTVPFPKGNVGYHHVHTPPPPPRKFNEKIPPEVEKIILKCLEKDPAKRYPSVEKLYEELKKSASVL